MRRSTRSRIAPACVALSACGVLLGVDSGTASAALTGSIDVTAACVDRDANGTTESVRYTFVFDNVQGLQTTPATLTIIHGPSYPGPSGEPLPHTHTPLTSVLGQNRAYSTPGPDGGDDDPNSSPIGATTPDYDIADPTIRPYTGVSTWHVEAIEGPQEYVIEIRNEGRVGPVIAGGTFPLNCLPINSAPVSPSPPAAPPAPVVAPPAVAPTPPPVLPAPTAQPRSLAVRASATQLRIGQRLYAVVRGNTAATERGRRISIELRRGQRWLGLCHVPVGPSGSFAVRCRLDRIPGIARGPVQLRARLPQTATAAGAVATFRLRR